MQCAAVAAAYTHSASASAAAPSRRQCEASSERSGQRVATAIAAAAATQIIGGGHQKFATSRKHLLSLAPSEQSTPITTAAETPAGSSGVKSGLVRQPIQFKL